MNSVKIAAFFLTAWLSETKTVDASTSSHQYLRGAPNQVDKAQILCRVTLVHTSFMSELSETFASKEQPSCIPIVDFEETDDIFPLTLPRTILDQYRDDIASGTLLVSLTNSMITKSGIEITDNTTYSVVHEAVGKLRQLQEKTFEWKENMSVAVVRISTLDSTPKDSASTLQETYFGNGTSFPEQYKACSFGKLQWQLAPAGVIEVTVNRSVSEFSYPSELVAEAQKTLSEVYNIRWTSQLADKVIMCLPPGTGAWAANAGVRHWRVQMNSDWCTSLSATMHELAHTLGVLHSNSDGIPYNDRSGYMGSGYPSLDWPRKCFNGYNSYQFGWYSTHHLSFNPLVDGDELIKLAAFVDFDKASTDEAVVVNVADRFYLQYNRAKGFNIDTEQKRDQLTITEPTTQGTDSLAGLSPGDTYEVPNFQGSGTLVIAACRSITQSEGPDLMIISVSMGESMCDEHDTKREITNAPENIGAGTKVSYNVETEQPTTSFVNTLKTIDIETRLPGDSKTESPATLESEYSSKGTQSSKPSLTLPPELESKSFFSAVLAMIRSLLRWRK